MCRDFYLMNLIYPFYQRIQDVIIRELEAEFEEYVDCAQDSYGLPGVLEQIYAHTGEEGTAD